MGVGSLADRRVADYPNASAATDGVRLLATADDGATVNVPLAALKALLDKRYALRDALDVRLFGAAGASDASGPLQSALDAAESAGGGEVFLPTGTYRLGSPLVVPAGVVLRGQGARQSVLKALDSFPSDTALVRLGRDDALAFGARLERLQVNCNDLAGSVGVYTGTAQEQAGVFWCLVTRYRHVGIWYDDPMPADGLFTANAAIEGVECYPSAQGSNYGIYFRSVSSKCHIEHVTCNGMVGGTHAAAVRIANQSEVHIRDLHVEYHQTGVEWIGGSSGSVIGLSTSGPGVVARLVNVTEGGASSLVLIDIKKGTAGIVIDDQQSGRVISSSVPLYLVSPQAEVVGSRSDGSALTSLLGALTLLGLITDRTGV